MVLISLGYLARWCDMIYHTSTTMEHTKIHREVFIHALFAYLLVAEVEWIRHGVSILSPTSFLTHEAIPDFEARAFY
jgi:hypothetical protein